MQLTDTRGTAFLVNANSVVYAYARGSEATILLARGNQKIDVAESVSAIVTASNGALVSFTSLSGDITGSVGVNPDYIVSVASYSNGTQSQLVIMDDDYNTTRTVITVSTAFASMDAILEVDATNVTLAGTPDYITISGQVITRNAIDLATDVTGVLPAANLPYSVYTASLTPVNQVTGITSGPLTVGKQYQILTYNASDDFSNVANVVSGTINQNDCVFIATGTTPTDWSAGTELMATKYMDTPVILGDNTVGVIAWTFDTDISLFVATLSGAFTEGKTMFITAPQSNNAYFSNIDWIDEDTLQFEVSNIGGAIVIEIRVYP